MPSGKHTSRGVIKAGISRIENPCYGQLTVVKARNPLTSIMLSYHQLRTHQGHMFF